MQALTWNLYHGRSPSGSPHALLTAFADMLAGWKWDVALLQEVPPWWPPALAAACGAQQRSVLTSRNLGLPLRRAIASRRPDLLKSNGGGANAILVRGPISAHRAARLTWWPERRWAQGVRVGDGRWVVNLHASTHREAWAARDVDRALRAAREWGPLALFGGDLNLRDPGLSGLRHVAGHHVDHLFVPGATGGESHAEVLERGPLSDHAPVRVSL